MTSNEHRDPCDRRESREPLSAHEREGEGLPAGRLSRRRFLLQGAAFAFSGVAVCSRQPREPIVPYVKQPDGLVPGRPQVYATASLFRGHARGIVAVSREGRPVKIEGNPGHPASLGGTDIFAQAAVRDLYDPDRSPSVLRQGQISTWPEFLKVIAADRARLASRGGRGLFVLTGEFTSPTLLEQLRSLRRQWPEARWCAYEAVADPAGSIRGVGGAVLPNRAVPPNGAALPNGAASEPDAVLHLDRADVILSLDGDFLFEEPGSVRYALDFLSRRRVRAGTQSMSRLYVLECMHTLTGSNADARLPVPASRVEVVAREIAARLGAAGGVQEGLGNQVLSPRELAWVEAAAGDLVRSRGAALVTAGICQPPTVHALARRMNEALGAVGRTVEYRAPSGSRGGEAESLASLVAAAREGQAELLLITGCNPAYDAPADLDFADALRRVTLSIHHGLHVDETARLCQWHIPAAHELEMWSDALAHDGTVTFVQPLIAPLYDGRSHHEIVAALAGTDAPKGYDIVRGFWTGAWAGAGGTPGAAVAAGAAGGAVAAGTSGSGTAAGQVAGVERRWRRALYDGVVAGAPQAGVPPSGMPQSFVPQSGVSQTGAPQAGVPQSGMLQSGAPLAGVPAPTPADPPDAPRPPAEGNLEIVFRPDPSVWDGRYANNPWLQELPHPVSGISWDNAAMISPRTAEALRLENSDVVELSYRGRKVEAPVWIVPGVADDCVVVTLGYGRTGPGSTAEGAGFNAYALRTSDAPWFGRGLSVRRLGRRRTLVTPQLHREIEGRDHLRFTTVEEFRRNPRGERKEEDVPPGSLYPAYRYDGYRWGMNIDLTACIGCNACTIACQAENNIPTVGREQVGKGRIMHWIRVDRYAVGPAEDPAVLYQPVPCMHCENAPCELVCPTGATTHSTEGLNQMIYNRCVGTRYCSNNCPYKVRRFNFYDYTSHHAEIEKAGANPDVTVRSRGVMEKCTYCVQRIEQVRIASLKENRAIGPDEVVPACAGACPTRAITFGDLNRPSSAAALAGEPHAYGMLSELNTRPRTSYLARVANPNPGLRRSEPDARS